MIATAQSTVVDAAIPAIIVSGAVATARIASATSPEQARPGEMPERLALEQDLREQEQRRAAEREDAEAERGIVAGMGDRELVADGDPDQCEDYQRQRPRAPVPDGASAPQATISPRSSAAP